MLWINYRECVSCGTKLRLGKHGFQECPGPAGAPSGTTLAMVCFFLNYTAVCQGFCGWFWGKALQGNEIRFIRERGLVSRKAIEGGADF